MTQPPDSHSNTSPTVPFVRDIGAKDFESAVLKTSFTHPVVVDFWAPWCGPCGQLGPVLEKCIGDTRGAVQMVKINIDQEPSLAQSCGVQSIPTVYAFYKGQPVDGFGGARPESEVKKFIDNLLKISGQTKPETDAIETWIITAQDALDHDRPEQAADFFHRILEAEPTHDAATAGLLRGLIRSGNYEEAQNFAGTLCEEITKNPHVQSALTALQLALESDTMDVKQFEKLQKRVDKKPNDMQAKFDLAKVLFVQNQAERAIDHLIDMIRHDRNWQDDAARKQVLEFFDILGPTHPLTLSGRRKLSSVLFS